MKQSYRLCQSLERGLGLLLELNRSPGGCASITWLSHATGIHRTTVKRLLETLVAQGYVHGEPGDNLYRLSYKVQALSAGFRDNLRIVDLAVPALRALGKAVAWPCSILTLEDVEMVVRVSTRPYSPYALHPGMPGRHLPLLSTAAGRVYLAFCPDEERETLLYSLRARGGSQAALAANASLVEKVLEEGRARGYCLNYGEWEIETKFGGIATPICHGGRVVAAINMAFVLSGMKGGEATSRYASQLRATARQIEEAYAALVEGNA
ncbi:IclR family transcriptional regulator C-terminal domain-containing protein [Pigmentiphaga sp. CHJ604]|uniref:IclR family transcriptional regulator domain-containing protein n=1 Tax=Pigmentiphaga sp. CHJ604 TaxID=3081984 RepID=UPI0030D3CCD6